MTNIILCGGSGTRLWPISRTLMPKQFVKLFNNKSLFQLTVERNRPICHNQFIVSNQEQYFLATDQLEEINHKNTSYLLEPIGRDTAPAIALACMAIDPEEIVLVTPSDHLIKNEKAYQYTVEKAKEFAENNYLVTFGITADHPETGYGYIEAEGENVKSFKEKPDYETAKKYIAQGNYYWNSGMFCFKAKVFLDELQKYAPKIYETSKEAFADATHIENFTYRIKQQNMEKIPSNSIDYAVMERSDKVKVIPSDIGWSDLGSFDALYEELPKDKNGNTLTKKHISIDSKNNLILTHNKKIATIDVEDLIIVDTPDALLITKKGSSQKVKKVVEKLKAKNSELTNVHTIAHRPWGTYEVLLAHNNYKIKRIVVKPGKRLSLQKHFHRNEHWIVVSGTATVTVGNEVKLIRPNESTYIKMGEIHRLENEGKIPVVLIEAQVGEYTGEDDIIRIDDDFRRNKI
jgi:mannose-1-phosphate guanylyltransferase